MSNFSKKINVGSFKIGKGAPCFIIAEAGVNHNGRIDLAKKLIAKARAVGASAVKFQTWRTENLIVRGTATAKYQKRNTGDEDQYRMLEKLELSYEDFKELQKYAKKVGIIFLSTPDEEESLDFLADKLNLPAIKIGSAELNNTPFLKKVAAKKKPIILSTGMATLDDVKAAVGEIRKADKNAALAVLHCTTEYPCPPEDTNLNVLSTYRTTFPDCIIGYSDHTQGIIAPAMAVALGAKVIEKHFTLDNNLSGPDHKASLNPVEFKKMTSLIRSLEESSAAVTGSPDIDIYLGSFKKQLTASENITRALVKKVIVAKENIPQGAIITEGVLAFKRTSEKGLPPEDAQKILGKQSKVFIKKDRAIKPKDVK